MYALKDKQGNVISNFDDIVKAAEGFYTDMYSAQNRQATFIPNSDEPDTEAPSITSDEIRRALKDMTRGKAAGEDYAEDEAPDSAFPEQSYGRHYGEGGSGGDRRRGPREGPVRDLR